MHGFAFQAHPLTVPATAKRPAYLIALLAALAIQASDVRAVSGVKVHKYTRYFFDVEAPMDRVWVGCTQDDLQKENSFMVFYVLDESTSYHFFYRRPYHVPMCLETERQYHRMMKGAKTVRIVGHHQNEEPGPQPPASQRIPARFTAVPKIVSGFFVRLQAGNQCKAYFDHHCELPKNYWGGVIPEE